MRDGSWMKPVAWDAVRGSFTWRARRKVQRIPSPTSQSRCHPKSTYLAALVLHASRPQKDTSLRRAIFRALAVRALRELSESVNFCFVSSVPLAIRRASRSNSVRSHNHAVNPARPPAQQTMESLFDKTAGLKRFHSHSFSPAINPVTSRKSLKNRTAQRNSTCCSVPHCKKLLCSFAPNTPGRKQLPLATPTKRRTD